jgi:hypothetical protein
LRVVGKNESFSLYIFIDMVNYSLKLQFRIETVSPRANEINGS